MAALKPLHLPFNLTLKSCLLSLLNSDLVPHETGAESQCREKGSGYRSSKEKEKQTMQKRSPHSEMLPVCVWKMTDSKYRQLGNEEGSAAATAWGG